MKKKVVLAGITAGLLASAGAAYAMDSNEAIPATSSRVVLANAVSVSATDDDTTDDSTSTDRAAEHETRLRETLQALVDDGTLTEAQLDSVVEALGAAGPMGGGGGHGMRGAGLSTVAEILGLTEDEVRTAIEGGQTLAELADANGSSADELIDALVADLQTHLDEEVTEGDLTQDEADAKLADATERITEFVNNTQEAGPAGGMGGPGGHGHGPGGREGAGDGSGTNGSGGSIDAGPSDSSTSSD